MKKTIGFTGTRNGMSDKQKKNVKEYLETNKADIERVLHGGCVGSDEDFHKMCRHFRREVYLGHSVLDPNDKSMRGNIKGANTVHEAEPYLKRNRNIVNICDVLLATPNDYSQRGGTWYTINNARGRGKNIEVIIFER